MGHAIEIKHLSKKYQLYHEEQSGYSTLVETFSTYGKRLFRRLVRPFAPAASAGMTQEEFWALQDISFSIEEGDRIGIIGRNGAGKSTLLKILSRITEPTAGQVKIRGRLSSLLEVGTGFHLELTGRENIYLNGAILGMKRNEIKSKFDEIVAFSEIEKFLDTPVKRFSSGMYMRLGFAIAAHLDSDILIMDEVLAVGDTQFQEKCFKKLNDLGSKGRTVLFVSHDIGAVLSLCNRGLYLDQGRIVEAGEITHCVSSYMRNCRDRTLVWQGDVGDEHIRIYNVALEGSREFFYQHERPSVHIDYEVLKPHEDLCFSIGVWNGRHQLLGSSRTVDSHSSGEYFRRTGKQRLSFSLDASLFRESEYLIKLHCAILNKKRISDDEIVLKFPVYEEKKDTLLKHKSAGEGIFLGNRWQHG